LVTEDLDERKQTMATQVKAKLHRPPPGEPWHPVVNVVLDPDNEKFKFQSDDIEVGPNNEITFDNDGQPGFVITFHLEEPRYGYRFPEDLKAALWSIDEPECPTEEHRWGQFKAKAVNNNGIDLVVRNLNEKKRTFGYALLVTDDGGQTFWPLDPVGTNNNGSTSRF
jgi:hypothetical protein